MQLILVVAPLLFLAGVTGLRAGASALLQRWQNPSVVQEAADGSKDVISTFTLVGHAEDGRKKWEIQGDTADLLTETVSLSPVSARSFGEIEVRLTAQHGNYHKNNQEVHLTRDVVVTTSDGARLTTEKLDWAGQKDTAYAPDWVTVTRPGMTLVGLGGTGYPKLKRIRIERQVTLRLQEQKGMPSGMTVVTCEDRKSTRLNSSH